MGGGLMQLVAYGAQDIYLTGNPQITFFKVVYRRHTNFSMETIQQTIQGTSTLTTSTTSGTVTISRNGDLVSKVYVTSNTAGILNGDAIVSEVELEIGGQRIDKQYTEWHQIWSELSTPHSKAHGLKAMKSCTHFASASSGDSVTNSGPGLVQLPLNFWFCRNPGLALPLIALQYHEVKLKFTWGTSLSSSVGALAVCNVFCDYIYLDTDERRRFAQVSHEYLIEQIQKQTASETTSQKLNFNHPVKEIIWTSAPNNTYGTAKLKLNGHDRFSSQEEEYFQLRQPFDYHSAVPHNNLPPDYLPGFAATGQQTITRDDHAIHTDGGGLATAACTTTSLTWVTVGGSTGILAAVPGATDELDNAATSASCCVIGGLNNVSCIKANSLRVGDIHRVRVYDQHATLPTERRMALKFIVLSNLSAVDTLVEVSGTKGPLHLWDSSATANTLAAGGAVGDITNATGGAILLCYDNHYKDGSTTTTAIDFGFTLESGVDFTEIVNMTHHDSIAPQGAAVHVAATSLLTKRINVYSFALKPEEHQPSGTCNFSRIDNAKLETNANLSATDNIYAVNYNVLRIMSGMGGLAYSN